MTIPAKAARHILAMARVYLKEAEHPLADPHATNSETAEFARAMLKSAGQNNR